MNESPQKVYLSLGTNIGNLTNNLENAINHIRHINNTTIDVLSPVYHTEPQGNPNLQWFHNQVIRLLVKNMTPNQLLKILLNIEEQMGRIRTTAKKTHYKERIIDLDILLFEKETCNNEQLVLPHPQILKRAFVLIPLNDIEPTLHLPGGLTPKDALKPLSYSVINNTIYQ